MENQKDINKERKYYGLNNLLAFCELQKCDEDKVLCYLECYRSDLKNKTKSPLFWLEYMVENYSYPMRKDYKENGPLIHCFPPQPPEELETKEKIIADIVKLEKELNIN